MSDLSGTCKHGTSRAKPCRYCMSENMGKLNEAIALQTCDMDETNPQMYTLDQARELVVKEIMEREDLNIAIRGSKWGEPVRKAATEAEVISILRGKV